MKFLNYILLVSILFISSCGCNINIDIEPAASVGSYEELNGFSNMSQVSGEDKTYSPDEVSIAVMLFYYLWERTFGDPGKKVYSALSDLIIIWMPHNWKIQGKAFNEEGQPVGDDTGVYVSGLTHNGKAVLVSHKQNLWETSLAHELVHVALMAINGSADPDHLGDKYKGWTGTHSAVISLHSMLLKSILEDPAAVQELKDALHED